MDAKHFLEGYQVTDIEKDPLPIKVLRYAITKKEIPGQAVHWAFEYLDQRNCPMLLINHIVAKLYHEVIETDFTACAESTEDSVDSGNDAALKYEPLKLMRAVVKILDEICIKEKEDFQDSVDGIVESPDMLPLVYAVSYNNIKNTRRFMEDRMTILPRMDRIFDLSTPMSYFAVFDGHNGSEAAAFGAAQLHQYLIQSMKQCPDVISSISEAFENLDETFVQKCLAGKVKSGSTAVVTLLMPDKLYVAWLGDSQAVLVKRSEVNNLVTPHKPERADEIDRIRSMGGEVFQMNGTYRVNGNLAVSRAIGDADDKAFIIPTPDIKMLELDGTEEFLILACDGLWDEISPDAAAQIVRHQVVQDANNVNAVSSKLIHYAKDYGSTDNISIIVVFLEPLEQIKNRYEGVMNAEIDLSVFRKTNEPQEQIPIDQQIEQSMNANLGLVMELNGHGKDTEQLVDFLSFGSSRESGAQLIGDEIDNNQFEDDVIVKKEVEDLSDGESDDEWQFEKPANQDVPISDMGATINNENTNNPFDGVEHEVEVAVNQETEQDQVNNIGFVNEQPQVAPSDSFNPFSIEQTDNPFSAIQNDNPFSATQNDFFGGTINVTDNSEHHNLLDNITDLKYDSDAIMAGGDNEWIDKNLESKEPIADNLAFSIGAKQTSVETRTPLLDSEEMPGTFDANQFVMPNPDTIVVEKLENSETSVPENDPFTFNTHSIGEATASALEPDTDFHVLPDVASNGENNVTTISEQIEQSMNIDADTLGEITGDGKIADPLVDFAALSISGEPGAEFGKTEIEIGTNEFKDEHVVENEIADFSDGDSINKHANDLSVDVGAADINVTMNSELLNNPFNPVESPVVETMATTQESDEVINFVNEPVQFAPSESLNPFSTEQNGLLEEMIDNNASSENPAYQNLLSDSELNSNNSLIDVAQNDLVGELVAPAGQVAVDTPPVLSSDSVVAEKNIVEIEPPVNDTNEMPIPGAFDANRNVMPVPVCESMEKLESNETSAPAAINGHVTSSSQQSPDGQSANHPVEAIPDSDIGTSKSIPSSGEIKPAAKTVGATKPKGENKIPPKTLKSPAKPDVSTKSRGVLNTTSAVKKSPLKPNGEPLVKPTTSNAKMGLASKPTVTKSSTQRAAAATPAAKPSTIGVNNKSTTSRPPPSTTRPAPSRPLKEGDGKPPTRPISGAPKPRPTAASSVASTATKQATGLKPITSPKKIAPSVGTATKPPTTRLATTGAGARGDAANKPTAPTTAGVPKARPRPAPTTTSSRTANNTDKTATGSKPSTVGKTSTSTTTFKPTTTRPPISRPLPSSARTTASAKPTVPPSSSSTGAKSASSRTPLKSADKPMSAPSRTTSRVLPPAKTASTTGPKKVESTTKPKKPAGAPTKPDNSAVKKVPKPSDLKNETSGQNNLAAASESLKEMNILNGLNGDVNGETEKQDSMKENGVHEEELEPAPQVVPVDDLLG